MAAAPRLKLADKQEIYKKVLSSLKKRYPSVPKPPELPVLETMLFAVCLENASLKEAESAFQKLQSHFHDLNEVRVSSIEELEAVFQGMSTPDWRAMRVRGILGHVFESTYSFEYDALKRKTLELATKQLSKIKELSPFVRDFTLHASLGAHVIPLDEAQFHAIEFLDLQAEGNSLELTAESLKPLVRKADGTEFSGVLREFANDAKLRPTIELIRQAANDGAILPSALVRFEKLLKGEPIKFDPPPKKTPEKKAAERAEKKELERKEAEKKELEQKDIEKKEAERKEKISAKSTSGKKVESPKALKTTEKATAEKPVVESVESNKAEKKSKSEKSKLIPAKVETSKTKPATSSNKQADISAKPTTGKSVSGKSVSSKAEKVASESVKTASEKPAAHIKPASVKTETKPGPKTELATKSDKNAKSATAPVTNKSEKPEDGKSGSKKGAAQAILKSEQKKTKPPAAVLTKEPPAKKREVAAAPAKESSKSSEKSLNAATKSNSKSAIKPTIEQKSTKKPTTKSGK